MVETARIHFMAVPRTAGFIKSFIHQYKKFRAKVTHLKAMQIRIWGVYYSLALSFSWFSYKQFKCFSEMDGVLILSLKLATIQPYSAQRTDDRIPSNLSDSFGRKMTSFPRSLFTSSYVKLKLFLVVRTLFFLSLPASSHFL